MSDVNGASKDATVAPAVQKRDRSPSFPYIGLGRAVERTQQLFNKARRFEVRLADAASAWGLGAKSSATQQTAAALLAFGLLDDSGSGDARKIKVSDLGRRILEDHRPGVRESALAEAALKPKLIAEYAEPWGDGRPEDNFCISELKIDRGFTEEAAERFLRVFDETIQFARLQTSDKLSDKEPDETDPGDKPQQHEPPEPEAKVGDYVQWTSGGVDQFRPPRRVTWISEDGSHLQVHGSLTGIPIKEVTVVDPPAPPPPKPPLAVQPPAQTEGTASQSAGISNPSDINVLLTGKRLQITADVDAAGLAKLKQMLDKYEEILKLLN